MLRRFLIFALFAFGFLAVSASAQTVQVSGTVLDPSGKVYQGCQVNISYVPSPTATTVPLIDGSTFNTTVPIVQCDSFGNFNVTLIDNLMISDGHTGSIASKWAFFVQSGNICFVGNKVGFNVALTITGTSQNVTSSLQSAAATLPTCGGGGGGGGGPALLTNGVTNPNQTVLNFVPGTGITITSNSAGAETFTATSANVSITNQAADAISSNVSGTPSVVDSTVCTPPSANGQYGVGYTITGGAAAPPTCPQVGLAPRGISGTTSTDTILYSDNNNIVVYLTTVNVATSLPTPTTLGNANFFMVLQNGSATAGVTVTITPAGGWTIDGNATAVIPISTSCSIYVDPVNATDWLAACAPLGVSVGGIATNYVSTNGGTANTFGSAATYGHAGCEINFGTTTLSGASTTSGLICLPPNSIILAVEYRITTTITTATSFTIGDSGSATRYCGTQSTLTAGTTGYCTAAGYYFNSGALGVKVTPSTTPGAGAIRLTVTYLTLTAPTS